MRREKLSSRQLSVAVLVGGLSTASAIAGTADWRWILVAIPVGMMVAWLLLFRVGITPLYTGIGGRILAILYGGWAVVLMADVLCRAARRLQLTSGNEGMSGWLLILLALPLLWMGWGKTTAFFRAVEIFWLAVLVMLVAVLALGVLQVEWRYVWLPVDSWWESLLAGAGVLATGLFVLPHIYKVEDREQGNWRCLNWLAVLGLLAAALAGLTVGILSPGVTKKMDDPFYVMAGMLGGSARLEGLISALWLLPDLTLAGLLSRVWGERRWPALAVGLALALAFLTIGSDLPGLLLPIGSLILVILTMALAPGGRNCDSGEGRTEHLVLEKQSDKSSKKEQKDS